MLRTMFKPFFKKFFGLFISMVFVSMLSVALLSSFGSVIVNVRQNYSSFVTEYQDIDEQISTNFASREKLLSVNEVQGVQKVDARLVIDCYLKKPDRTIVARVFTYNEQQNNIFKRYVLDKTEKSVDKVNISIARKFANNNNFKLGQTIKLGFFDMYEEFYISEIVETVEGIYPRANNYIWSDNYDFGYLYASEQELAIGIERLAQRVVTKYAEDPDFKEYYDKFVEVTGLTIPDLIHIDDSFVSTFANQLLIKNVDSKASRDSILALASSKLEGNNVKITSSLVRPYLPHIAYMDHALEQVQIASIFLPVFFYSVTMIVIALFVAQIIKSMTSQIGVLMSIGIGAKEIFMLFFIFALFMSLCAGFVGTFVGFGLNALLSGIMRRIYSIPTITASLNPLITTGAIIGLIVFSILTTLLACRAIFRITPKDATISNEAKRKRLPKKVEDFIDKAPMNIKLGVNSVMQNPRRFFVSSFSIFASMALIILVFFFSTSKEELVNQSVNRRLNYDAQIYMTAKEEDSFVEEFKMQSFVEDFENCYYTYLKVDTEEENVYIECLAVDPGLNPMINIPKSNGHGSLAVPEMGVILPKTTADKLHVRKGNYISVEGHALKVEEISFQYFHPITYLSHAQMDVLTNTYVSSFILDVNNETALLDYLSANKNQCLTVFTSSLSKDLHNIFDTINIMIFIMVGFSLLMAFLILTIMSQNALMEQKRQLTVLRAIGFTVGDISNFWTFQSVLQLLSSSVFGIPVGAFFAHLLLSMASNASQVYPYIFSWPILAMTAGFISLVVFLCHLFAMYNIRKWNIADNTRSRE